MSTDPAALRYELAELLAELLALASDAQIADVLRKWAADATCAGAPRLAIADLIGRMRATLQKDYADPALAAAAVQRINAVLTSLRAQ